MRAIDADELKKCVLKWLPKDPCGIQEKEMPFETDICVSMLMEIEEQPTIHLEQRTGKWIPQDHNKRVGNISTCVYYYPTCSECGQVGNEIYKYCPHCGAKMLEGDAE